MQASLTKETRVPLSLRLPARLVNTVDEYAASHGMSRTDAFLHYLELGIGDDGRHEQRDLLTSISGRLDEALRMLDAISPIAGNLNGEIPNRGITTELAHAVAEACSAFPAVEYAYVFGSFARGTAGPKSDVDIRIELSQDAKFNLHDLDHLCKLLEQLLGRSVDVISAREIKNEGLARAIEKEKVLVYERETR